MWYVFDYHTFSLGIFFFAHPSQIIGYLGQISSWACENNILWHKELFSSNLFSDHSLTLIFLKWNGSLQYLQLSVLSGHSRSLWRSCSFSLMSSLHKGHGRIMNSHFPSWLNYKKQWYDTSYPLNNEKLSIYARYLCTCSCYLIIFNTAFPGAAFVEAHSWKMFNFSSGSIVGKRLRKNTGNVHALQ